VNNQEAKFILSAYRPSGEDACGATFAAALEQVNRDPELAAWFAEERALDAATSDALCSIPIPPDLRANILAGAKISRRHLWSLRPTLLAIAASLVLFAAVASIWTRQSQLDPWQNDALAVISKFAPGHEPFDYAATDSGALQQWLRTQNAPAPEAIPAALQALPTLGCKTISSRGKTVSIICFRMKGGEIVHLIVTEATGLNHMPPPWPRFVRENDWATATWTDKDRAYMLATKAADQQLRDLFAKWLGRKGTNIAWQHHYEVRPPNRLSDFDHNDSGKQT
jgi:hypothetical protein